MSLSLRLLFKWSVCLASALAVSSVHGLGVEAVTVVGITDTATTAHYAAEIEKWGEQMLEWGKQLEKMQSLIRQGDELAKIIGDPKSVIESVSTLSGASEQLDYIFRTETTGAIRKGIKGAESLDKAGKGLGKTVDSTVMVGGKKQNRNTSLYGVYSLLERMHSNYEDIVDNDKKVQEREAKRQKALIDALLKAQTEWDRERIRAAIETSKGVQAASSNAVFKAKEAYDAETMAVELENKKQALAQMEAAEMQRQHMNRLIDESNRRWQDHLEKEYFAETTVDNKIELLIKKHPQP